MIFPTICMLYFFIESLCIKIDFEKLLDKLSNYFVEHGIDKKEEINAIGYNIERLIGKLSIIYDEN